jgi:hypothetical protein
MNRIWTEERIRDALQYTWDEFQERHPGISNYNGWKGARTEGRTRGWDTEETEAPDVDTTLQEEVTVDLPAYEIKADGDIFINRTARTIVSYLGAEYGTVTVSFERHAAMRRRYADEWEHDTETIPEIARDFDLAPKAFERYKTLHGWTHASDPFTDEEWREGLTVEDAVTSTLESHRRAFHKKLQKEKWAAVISDADKWRRFEQTALEPIMEAVRTHAPVYVPPRLYVEPSNAPYDLVFCPSDFHYGKFGWEDETGRGYSRKEAEHLLHEKTARVLQLALRYGRPERIICAIGSDWFHVDNAQGATTNGTPQDLDGSPSQILWEGTELAVAQLAMLRQIAPLDIYYMAGNHDRMLGYALLCTVRAWFRNDAEVRVHQSPHPRQYCRSGATLIGFTHGDGPKLKELPLTMAVESAELWGQTTHRAWFTGHLHHEITYDTMGVLVYQLPSLSGNDNYHTLKGYTAARRSLCAYVVDHVEGVISTVMAPVL